MEIILPRHKAWKNKMRQDSNKIAKSIIQEVKVVATEKHVFSAKIFGKCAFLAAIILIGGCIAAKPAHADMLSAHFAKAEFNQRQQPLALNSFQMDSNLIQKLESLRRICKNRPIVVTSGYRTPSYNARVGGVGKSQHILGKAADIRVEGIDNRMLANYARIVGFTFVKVYSNHVHVDVR